MAKTRTRTKAAQARMHGLYVMQGALTEYGNRVIDPASELGKAVNEWEQGIIADLGGEEALSMGKRELIALAKADAFMLASIDAYIAELGTGIINRRHRKLYPIVEARGKVADRLHRRLDAIYSDDHQRKARPVTSLREYLGDKP